MCLCSVCVVVLCSMPSLSKCVVLCICFVCVFVLFPCFNVWCCVIRCMLCLKGLCLSCVRVVAGFDHVCACCVCVVLCCGFTLLFFVFVKLRFGVCDLLWAWFVLCFCLLWCGAVVVCSVSF